MFTASMVIGICKLLNSFVARLNPTDSPILGGDLFVDDAERKAMMDMLIKTDLDLAWPTGGIQSYLRQKWGWAQ